MTRMLYCLLLLVLVAACNAKTPEKMLKAFSQVESTHNPNALGDEVKASSIKKSEQHKYIQSQKKWFKSWGKYQFQYDRWIEVGGNAQDWGKANEAEQDRVMCLALKRYQRNLPKNADYVRWVATWHNSGHGMNTETPYVKRIRAALKG